MDLFSSLRHFLFLLDLFPPWILGYGVKSDDVLIHSRAVRWHEKRTSLGAFIDIVFLLGKNSFSLKSTVLSHFPIPVDITKMHASYAVSSLQMLT